MHATISVRIAADTRRQGVVGREFYIPMLTLKLPTSTRFDKFAGERVQGCQL